MTKITTIANIFIGLIILLHIYFQNLEMFFWDKPLGLRTFGLKQEFATASKSLAANQGLYNGFLAAGLILALIGAPGTSFKVFFLSCVVVAGVFGGLTGNRKIILVQAIPGAIALVLVWLS